MDLRTGTRLGPFEIISLLGVGGMGEVYRANDTRLDRTVAIKVLPSRVSSNAHMKARFEREARSISKLSHPNICSLHDIGHQEGIDFLVMEYLEGETLADRLTKGPFPINQVLRYAAEIADALDTAHRQNIVHRDLKPSNIMLTRSGTKLLDFGLAKLREPNADGLTANMPISTIAHQLTGERTILGTPQYMSPEQLEGKEVDARTDIFSFGAVLYEMATGRKAFTGNTLTNLISAILKSEPPLVSTIQPLSSPSLDHVVQVCLAKNPDDRWQTAHDLRLQLKWIAEGSLGTAIRTARRMRPRAMFAWILSAFLLSAVTILAFTNYHFMRILRAREGDVQKFSILSPGMADSDSIAVSPDGHLIAFAAGGQLWLRSFHSLDAVLLPETESANNPFWSPDSRFIGFFAKGKLKKIALAGGSPGILSDASDPFPGRGGTWNQDGVILFSGGNFGPLFRIDAAGGERTPVTTLDMATGEDAHRWPYFLPDGQHFLYFIHGERAGIYLGSLDSKEKKLLLPESSKAEYVPGYLLFVHHNENSNDVNDGSLMAVGFDTNRFTVNGNPFPVAEKVAEENEEAHGGERFSVSTNDVLIYKTPAPPNGEFHWFDRKGKQLSLPILPEGFGFPAFSPDEKKIAISNGNIWIFDLSKESSSRLTFEPFLEATPAWSPDGERIAFGAVDDPCCGLYVKPADGTGRSRRLVQMPGFIFMGDWSRDGRYLLFCNRNAETKMDLWALPLFGDQKPFPFLKTKSWENSGKFSPDGKWVVYSSDESGMNQIYVRGFPPSAGGQWQISTDGGTYPVWQRDGKELFFLGPDNKIMAVPVKTDPTFHAEKPEALFERKPPPTVLFNSDLPYQVSADGQRFLVNSAREKMPPTPITVVLNWKGLLKK